MMQPVLGELFGISWLFWYQPVLLILLIAVIAGFVIYRRKQM
jgi:cytochrome c-type biogenesis protein CcmH/NrfF